MKVINKKPLYKKWWFWAILSPAAIIWFIIMVAIITTVFSSLGDSDNKTPASSLENKGKGEKEAEVYSIGEAILLKDTSITVDEVNKFAGKWPDEAKDGMEYVIVSVLIENKGKKNIYYNPLHFQMINSNGQVTRQAFSTINRDTALKSGELIPGGKVTGTIIFEQPINDPELRLQYKPTSSNNSIIINLY